MTMRVVICGGGSAGCAVSARLARTDCDVTLLEAGDAYAPGQLPPLLAKRLRPILDMAACSYSARAGGGARAVTVPGARSLGGASVINGTVALRGHPDHFDAWERYVGGFAWESWLPWFKAGERDCDYGHEPWHGSDGPMVVSREHANTLRPLQQAFVEAAVAQGNDWIEDHNAPGALGVGPVPLNARGGCRQTAAEGYLRKATQRKLRVLTGQKVQRIVFDGSRAIGVDVARDGAGAAQVIEADAVISTLGAVGTPRLLIGSGVGPEREVRRGGARLVAENDLIGSQILDHVRLTLRFKLRQRAGHDARLSPYQTLLTTTMTVAGRTRYLQILPYCESPQPHLRGTTVLHLQLLDPAVPERAGIAVHTTNEHGSDIALPGLRAEGERQFAQEALEYARALAAAVPLRSMIEEIDSAETVEERIGSYFHLAGSCPIGDSAERAASHPDGRVRGTSNVYVMDAAAMPALPSANIHMSVLALADRLASAFCTAHGLAS